MSQNTRWFHDLTTDEARQERATLAQRLIAVLGVLCFVVLVGVATNAYSTPIYKTEAEDGATIILHDDACTLKEVTNLKFRATWTEKGKTTEGCFGGHPAYPIIIFYFADGAVFVAHKDVFEKLPNA